jgi:hypothetical protein
LAYGDSTFTPCGRSRQAYQQERRREEASLISHRLLSVAGLLPDVCLTSSSSICSFALHISLLLSRTDNTHTFMNCSSLQTMSLRIIKGQTDTNKTLGLWYSCCLSWIMVSKIKFLISFLLHWFCCLDAFLNTLLQFF